MENDRIKYSDHTTVEGQVLAYDAAKLKRYMAGWTHQFSCNIHPLSLLAVED